MINCIRDLFDYDLVKRCCECKTDCLKNIIFYKKRKRMVIDLRAFLVIK